MVMKRIQGMMESCDTGSTFFPPTILYNESWLVRLILDWFSIHNPPGHPLTFHDKARWFSEALLPSAFLTSPKGRNLAEGWSHADGVIGHFNIGKGFKADLSLLRDANQLMVLEAKMFSALARGTSNARYYDQAARMVGCIAETLARAEHYPSGLTSLSFCVLAPASRIEQGVFAREMDKHSIRSKVERRVKEYVDQGEPSKRDWYAKWFLPTLERMSLRILSWEEIVQEIAKNDPESGMSFQQFYTRCVSFGTQSTSLPVDCS
jgi:hypothetical protein